jgi:aryl-alcohol dehydrogenase-like predicted oxidoreductase
VARARRGDPAGARGAWDRIRLLQPARQGLPRRHDRPEHDVRQQRLPHHRPRFDVEAREANQAFVELVRRIAERKSATSAQIALAWGLAQKPWIVPIPGTTKLHRVEENIAAADLELTPDDLHEIEDMQLEAQGARYAEAQQRTIDR